MKKIARKLISPVYAFIDSQNLNLGVRSQGWKLDWRKFRQYLRNKYHVSKACVCIGHVNPFSRFIVRIDRLRGSLELKKHATGIGGRSKP